MPGSVILSNHQWNEFKSESDRRKEVTDTLEKIILKNMDCSGNTKELCETCQFLQQLLDIIK